MIKRRSLRSSRRLGAALLVVLATLILVTTAATILVGQASAEQLRRTFHDQAASASDLLIAADDPIRDWLVGHSTSVVLAPDALEPRVEILNDTWQIDGTDVVFRITAWDQCGMLDSRSARSGNPMRHVLPQEVRRVFDRRRPADKIVDGLDLYEAALRPRDEIVIFPVASDSEAIQYGSHAGVDAALESPTTPDAPTLPPTPTALGAFIATAPTNRLNINTAPIDLVAVAFRRAGRDGIDLVIEARAAGEQPEITEKSNATRRRQPLSRAGRLGRIELATTSTRWSFRIDTAIGRVHRSWWVTYQLSDTSDEEPQTWECTQRLAVVE